MSEHIPEKLTFEHMQDVLERQGVDMATAGPDDYFFERATHYPVGPLSPTSAGKWYAIPRHIVAFTPYSGERDEGVLHEDGSFVSDQAKVEGVRIPPKVLIMGASTLRNVNLINSLDGWPHNKTIIDNASINGATIWEGCDIRPGVKIQGKRPMRKGEGRVTLNRGAQIGQGASIEGETTLSTNVRVAAKSEVIDSSLSRDVKVGFNSDGSEAGVLLINSNIGPLSIVGAGTRLESVEVGDGAKIGSGVWLDNYHVDHGMSVKDGVRDNASSLRKLLIRLGVGERRIFSSWKRAPKWAR